MAKKEPVKELTKEEQEALLKAKPHKCPFCEYRAAQPSLISRHVNHFHKELKSQTPNHLIKILSSKKTVPEMITAVADWTENATTFDDKLPEDVISYLRREDAKTQLILRVIAISKIQRAMELGDKMKSIDGEFNKRLEELNQKKDVSPQEYLGLLERMHNIQMNELRFLKEISQLGEVNLNDVIDKLVTAFGSSKLGTKPTGGVTAFQLTGVNIPDDPGEREQLRRILRGLTGEKDDASGRNKPIETEVTESTGTDTKANREVKKS